MCFSVSLSVCVWVGVCVGGCEGVRVCVCVYVSMCVSVYVCAFSPASFLCSPSLSQLHHM